MKRAYVACATVTLALGALAGCKKNMGTTGGSGGTGGTTGASPTTSTSVSGSTTGKGATTTGSMTTTTGSMTTTTGSMTTSSSTGTGQMCSQTYTNVPKGMCDLLAQDCAGNMTCVPTFDMATNTWSTGCQVMGGLKAAGATCASDTECSKGLICIGTMNGYCGAVCCPGGTCSGGGECNVMVTLDMAGTKYFQACSYSPACTLFMPNACMAGLNCNYQSTGLTTCNTQAQPPVPEGGACTHLNDCGNMQGCFGPQGGTANCRYMCKVGSTAAAGLGGCPTGQTCGASPNLGLDSGTDHYGVCAPAGG